MVSPIWLALGVDRQTHNDLRRLAESQRGLFSAAQAAQLGVPYRWLARAAADGYLRRPRRGVYAMAGQSPSAWEPMIAAGLRAGAEGVISHSTAASVHRLACAAPVPLRVEMTVPERARNRLSGVTVHRAAHPLGAEDVMTKYGISITKPERTLADMAGRLDPPLLAYTLDEGLLARRWTVPDILECLQRAPSNLPGKSALRKLLELRVERPSADSFLEIEVFEALKPLRPFDVHYPLTIGPMSYLIDAAWPDRKVGAEVVGRSHRVVSRGAFDRERRKLNALAGAGWRIAHLTASMPAHEMLSAVQVLLDSEPPWPIAPA